MPLHDHSSYPIELATPEWLARVEDMLLKRMAREAAMAWSERFLRAIKPGADLEKVKGPFLVFVLQSVLEKFDHEKFPDCKKAIDDVIALWSRPEAPNESEARAAAEAAWAAAEATSVRATEPWAAAEAAWAARWAAEAAWAARWAARAAARAAVGWVASAVSAVSAVSAEYEKFSTKLVELLEGVS